MHRVPPGLLRRQQHQSHQGNPHAQRRTRQRCHHRGEEGASGAVAKKTDVKREWWSADVAMCGFGDMGARWIGENNHTTVHFLRHVLPTAICMMPNRQRQQPNGLLNRTAGASQSPNVIITCCCNSVVFGCVCTMCLTDTTVQHAPCTLVHQRICSGG